MNEIIYKKQKIELFNNSENQKSVHFSNIENPMENSGFTLSELNIDETLEKEEILLEIEFWIDEKEEAQAEAKAEFERQILSAQEAAKLQEVKNKKIWFYNPQSEQIETDNLFYFVMEFNKYKEKWSLQMSDRDELDLFNFLQNNQDYTSDRPSYYDSEEELLETF